MNRVMFLETGNKNYLRVDIRRISDGYIMNQEFVRWDDTEWVNYKRKKGAGRILEGDIITFFGDFKGIKTYTSVS